MADNIIITMINTHSFNSLRTPYDGTHSLMHTRTIYGTPTKCYALLLGSLGTAVSKDRGSP